MSEFAGSRNSQSNVTDITPVSNLVGVTVGVAEALIVNPDPVNYRRVHLHNELPSESFRIRLGNYLSHVFLDGDVASAAMAGDSVAFDATADTATRTVGSWIDDGFVDGMVVTVAVNGASIDGTPGIVIDDGDNDFVRDAGSWLDDGYFVGCVFAVLGSASNNNTLTVTAVTATTLTVASITVAEATQTDLTMEQTTNNNGTLTIDGDPTALVLQFEAADVTVRTDARVAADTTVTGVADQVTLTAHGYDTGDGPYKLTAGGANMTLLTSIVINGGGPDNLTRTVGSWVDEGFIAGMTITIAGSASNEGTEVVDSVTATVLTTVGTLTPEGAQTDLTVTSPGALPGGVDATTLYYVRVIDDNTVELYLSQTASTRVNDATILPVNIDTPVGGGTHILGGMLDPGLGAEPPLPATDGYSSFKFDDAAPRTFSAPKSMTVIGSAATAILTCWWTP